MTTTWNNCQQPPVRVFGLTYVVVVLPFLIRLRAVGLGMLRVGECLKRGNILVQGSQVLLNHIGQFGDLDWAVVEERFPFRH
jgi:hypothetical protein